MEIKRTPDINEKSACTHCENGREDCTAVHSRAVRTAGACVAAAFCLFGIFLLRANFEDVPAAVEEAPVYAPAIPEQEERIVRLEEEMDSVLGVLQTPAAVQHRFFDMDRLMKLSSPGRAVLDYNRRCIESADKAISEIDAVIKGGTQDKDGKLKAEREHIVSLKGKIIENSNRFFRQLVRKTLKDYPLDPGVVLIESSLVYSLPPSVDLTEDLAGRMSYIKPGLPEVPEFKVTVADVSKQESAKAPPAKSTAKKSTPKKAVKSGRK